MKTVKAKFRCTETTKQEGSYFVINAQGNREYQSGFVERVKFQVVQADKPENETFAQYSPYGNMEVVIANQTLMGHFQPGKEYIFDINEA